MTRLSPRLDGGLIARKGEAAPTSPPQAATTAPEPPAKADAPKGTAGTTAVTVRLDSTRYRQLKIHGLDHGLSNQEILVAALDAYLRKPTEGKA